MGDTQIALPVFDIVKSAWDKVKGAKKTMWAVLGCMIALRVVMYLLEKGGQAADNGMVSLVVFLLFLGLSVVYGLFLLGLMYIGAQRAIDSPIQFDMVKRMFNESMCLKIIGLYFLTLVVLLPSIICLFLGGFFSGMGQAAATSEVANNAHAIYQLSAAFFYLAGFVVCVFLMMRMYIAPLYIAVDGLNPWAAIKASFAATKCNVWRLIGLQIINTLIVVVSVIPFGIGLIWTLPYMFISYGFVYKTLKR